VHHEGGAFRAWSAFSSSSTWSIRLLIALGTAELTTLGQRLQETSLIGKERVNLQLHTWVAQHWYRHGFHTILSHG
jgi:hypothetical protein